MPGIWDLLMQAVGPQDAEAKVVPRDPAAADLVNAIQEGWTMAGNAKETNPLVRGDFDPLKKQIYQQVLAAAQRRPETVTVGMDPTLTTFGEYQPQTRAIRLAPTFPGGLTTAAGTYAAIPPTALPEQENLSHELLHFLQRAILPGLLAGKTSAFPTLGPRPPRGEDVVNTFGSAEPHHDLIRYLLGQASAPTDIQAYATPVPFAARPPGTPAMDALRRAFLAQILTDPQLRARAMQGLEPPADAVNPLGPVGAK